MILVSSLMFLAQSTTRDYIRADGDYQKEKYSWKDPIKQRKDRKSRARKRRVVRRIYRMKYSWKGYKDRNGHTSRLKRSEQAWLFYVKHKPKHPHHEKMSPRGPLTDAGSRAESPRNINRLQNMCCRVSGLPFRKLWVWFWLSERICQIWGVLCYGGLFVKYFYRELFNKKRLFWFNKKKLFWFNDL